MNSPSNLLNKGNIVYGRPNNAMRCEFLDFLYKENYEIIEASYGYLICGTVKFLKPVEPCDEGYLCSLTSNIEAVDMKNGTKVFSKTFVHEATGKNWNSCVSKCKSELAKMIVDEIFFGM